MSSCRFFEWKRDQAKKQPYFIYFPDIHQGKDNSSVNGKVKKEENGTVVKSETDPIRDVKEEKVKVKEEGKDDEAGAPEDSVVKKEEKFEIKGANETDQMKQGKCFSFSH